MGHMVRGVIRIRWDFTLKKRSGGTAVSFQDRVCSHYKRLICIE
jgi:hypothetical protein